MFKFKRPMGTCARCGIKVVDADWIAYCIYYIILDEDAILHFCKSCYEREK